MRLYMLFDMLFGMIFQMKMKIKKGLTYKVKRYIFSAGLPQCIHCITKYLNHEKRAHCR